MVVLKNISIILLYIFILGQVQASEPKAKVDVQVEALNTNESSEEMVSGAGIIEVEYPVHDFGAIRPNSSNECEFKFKNTGTGTLEIKKIDSTCGCTVPKLEKKTYAPSESGTIQVTYKSSTRQGPVAKHLHIQSNDSEHPAFELTIKANVELKVALNPEKLKLSLRDENANIGNITLAGKDGKPFSIKSFSATQNIITVNIDPAQKATEFVLKPKVDLEKLKETNSGSIIINLTHPECDQVSLRFEAMPVFQLSHKRLIARNAEPEKPIIRQIWVRSNYGDKIEIESIISKEGTIEVLNRQPEENAIKLEIQITPPAKVRDWTPFMDELKIKLKDGYELKSRLIGWFEK